MKKPLVFIIALILCFCCAVSTAERKVIERDQYYLGAMRVVNCRDFVNLRERPDKTSKSLAKVPLDAIVQYCSNNVSKYANGKYKQQYKLFIRCEYEGQEGYILKKHLVPAPEAEMAETRQNNDLMTREQVIGNGKVVLDWKEFNVSVLAAYETAEEKDGPWEYLRVGCFIDDEPAWGYTEGVQRTGQFANLKAFMGGTEDEPQVYVYDAEYGLIMLDLMDGMEMWTLPVFTCSLGNAAVCAVEKNTGNMFIAGTDGPDPVAISPEGDVLWKSDIDDPEVYSPKEIELNPADIVIRYESGKVVSLDYEGQVQSISEDF